MRNLAIRKLVLPLGSLAGAAIVGGLALSVSTPAAAAPVSGGAMRTVAVAPGIEQVQYRSSTCSDLRRACMYKRELGEVGEGNCRRYRAECGNGSTGYSSRYGTGRAYRPYDRTYDSYRYRRGYWD